VLISGMRAEAPPPLPVLVVQGDGDRMMTAPSARAFAKGRPNVTYREIAGGHLIFLSETEKVRPVFAAFLSDLERRATALPSRK
jgi:pimeloyl-ACP methyl ester carboxylesterase